jgi:hypothetical protein
VHLPGVRRQKYSNLPIRLLRKGRAWLVECLLRDNLSGKKFAVRCTLFPGIPRLGSG